MRLSTGKSIVEILEKELKVWVFKPTS